MSTKKTESGIKPVKHIIDLDADPFVPKDWKVIEHQRGGTFEWDPDCVQLYLSTLFQTKGEVIGGADLREALTGKPVFNACLLDYLLAHPHLIPDDWKGKRVFFWGTVYFNSDGDACVRYLYWIDGQWCWSNLWFLGRWGEKDFAALRASA